MCTFSLNQQPTKKASFTQLHLLSNETTLSYYIAAGGVFPPTTELRVGHH